MKRKKTRNYVRNCFFVVIIGVMLLAFIGKCFYQSNKELICVIYRIYNTKIQEPIRILQLADLHNSIEYSDRNKHPFRKERTCLSGVECNPLFNTQAESLFHF